MPSSGFAEANSELRSVSVVRVKIPFEKDDVVARDTNPYWLAVLSEDLHLEANTAGRVCKEAGEIYMA